MILLPLTTLQGQTEATFVIKNHFYSLRTLGDRDPHKWLYTFKGNKTNVKQIGSY